MAGLREEGEEVGHEVDVAGIAVQHDESLVMERAFWASVRASALLRSHDGP